jgi:uncharacterized protein with beta-barrel porin domain
MSQAHSRRLLSGVSFIALVSTVGVASAAETFPAGANAARTITADTDAVDVQAGAVVFTDGNGNSIVVANGVTVNDPGSNAVTVTNATLLGTFVNDGAIISNVNGDGIYAGGSDLLGGIVNTGVISATSDGIDLESVTLAGGITNTGTITSGSAGIEVDSGTIFAGGITNSGTISGGTFGVVAAGGTTFSDGIDNVAGGAIDGGLYGIYAGPGATFDGGINNAGDITGTTGMYIASDVFEDGIQNVTGGRIISNGGAAINVVSLDFAGGILNQGAITSTGAAAVFIDGGEFAGGVNNQGNITATGGTALYIGSTAFAGPVTNSGSISSNTVGIQIDTLITDGVTTSGTIVAPTAIDMQSIAGQTVTQTGGLIAGDILFSTANDSYFVAQGGKFEGDMVGSNADNDELTVDGVWRAEGTGTGLGPVTVIGGTGVFGGDFRGDLAGTGFDITSTTSFNTTFGRAYIDDNTGITVDTQSYGGEGTLEFLLTSNTLVHGNISSTGAATLDGRLAVYLDWNSFAGLPGQDFFYIDLINSSGLVDDFVNATSVDTNSIFFTATSSQFLDAAVDVSVHRIGFDELLVAPTSNQVALGGALETVFVAGGPAFLALEDPAGNGLQNPQESNEGLYSALFQLPSAGAYAAALNSLDGHLHAQLAEATFNVNDVFDESIRTRLTSVHAGLAEQYWSRAGLDGPKRYASAVVSANDASGVGRGGNPGVASGRGPWSIWSKAIYQGADFEGDANAEGFDQDIHGFGAGADYAFSPRTVAGLAVQFADSDIEFDQTLAPPGQADIESWQIAAYLSHGFGPVYLDAVGSVSFNSYETHRLDFLGQPISADYDSTVYSIYGELGTVIGDQRSFRFQPYAGVGYRSADVDDFVETCPTACLSVTTDDPESLYTDVGLSLSKTYQWGTKTFVPELRASWTHDFDDDRNVFQADLLGLPGTPFEVTGSEFDEDRFNLGASATLAVNEGLELYAGYRYTFADDLDAHMAVAGVRATW